MIRVVSKSGRIFWVQARERGLIFVGTPPVLSDMAAQLLVHEAMEPTGLKPSATWTTMRCEEAPDAFTGVGYRITLYDRKKKRNLKSVLKVLEGYEEDV